MTKLTKKQKANLLKEKRRLDAIAEKVATRFMQLAAQLSREIPNIRMHFHGVDVNFRVDDCPYTARILEVMGPGPDDDDEHLVELSNPPHCFPSPVKTIRLKEV